jgi:hypothetical protein
MCEIFLSVIVNTRECVECNNKHATVAMSDARVKGEQKKIVADVLDVGK